MQSERKVKGRWQKSWLSHQRVLCKRLINLFLSENQYGNGGKDCNITEVLPVATRERSAKFGPASPARDSSVGTDASSAYRPAVSTGVSNHMFTVSSVICFLWLCLCENVLCSISSLFSVVYFGVVTLIKLVNKF